jgi:mRNA-degrading endonuclease YafQ of YafQ-DinJ toxin-antitoxin module
MPKIEWSNSFKRDYRRIKAAPRYRNLNDLLRALLVLVESDQALPQRYNFFSLAPLAGRGLG